MRRRRYLHTAGLAVTGGLAGCSELGVSNDRTPMATDKPTPTETPTPDRGTDAAPGTAARRPPLWLLLLAREHLDNTGEFSDQSGFMRMDWEWYLEMRSTSPEWGPTRDESWTFEVTKENAGIAPSADILKTPQYGAIITAFNAEVGVFNFPNLGPEMERQCGMSAEAGEREAARVVDEVVTYHSPNVTICIGADTDAVHDALADNDRNEFDDAAVTAYSGVEEVSAQTIVVSETWSRGMVAVETGKEQSEDLLPLVQRLADRHESLALEPSVRWCLGEDVTEAPVVTG